MKSAAELKDAQGAALEQVRKSLATDDYWGRHPALARKRAVGAPAVHLAIFIEPYLSMLFEGTKTVESRFSTRRVAPWKQASAGDVMLLKRSGGPVVGVCSVVETWYFPLNPQTWELITTRFAKDICSVDPDLGDLRSDATLASLLRVGNVRRIEPVPFPKSDRRGWVVLSPR